jgi:hypothetical protein
MSTNDFAPAPPPATVNPMTGAPSMPMGQASAHTVQKEVLNKQLILAITSELKSLISTYEKKFEGEDFTVDDAKIYISNFLESLAFHAEKIAGLIGEGAPEEGMPGEGVEMPQEEVMPPEPVAEEPPMEEEPVETGTLPEPSAQLSEPFTPEANQFTEPEAAIGGM